MDALERSLAGCSVGLSISESDDSAAVIALFGQGARVVFGHDCRDDGVMEAVHGFALQVHQPDACSPDKHGRPLLQNLLPWPDKPRLAMDELERLRPTLLVEEAGLPPELLAISVMTRSTPDEDELRCRYLRARALTHMRHLLNERIDARVSIGGRTGGSQGRYPGIIEEALLAVQDQKPLYLVGLLGGATQQLIDALEGRDMPGDFCHPSEMRRLYEVGRTFEHADETRRDRDVDPSGVWSTFSTIEVKGLARVNKLSEAENEELFHTPALDRTIDLILVGLARVRKSRGV